MCKHANFATLDELVNFVNDNTIDKTDILKIHFWKEKGRWYLVYWE